jgi:hypothetical protein
MSETKSQPKSQDRRKAFIRDEIQKRSETVKLGLKTLQTLVEDELKTCDENDTRYPQLKQHKTTLLLLVTLLNSTVEEYIYYPIKHNMDITTSRCLLGNVDETASTLF